MTRCPAKLILRSGPPRAVIKYKRPGGDASDASAWFEEEVGLEGVGDAVRRATDVSSRLRACTLTRACLPAVDWAALGRLLCITER